jgi:hypothetical protein
MKRRARTVASLLLASWAALAAQGQLPPNAVQTPSDDEIRRLLVQKSLAAYPGVCPCPESRNRSGNRCGGNSAYSRPGGEQPLCYLSDVTAEMISRYREELAKR